MVAEAKFRCEICTKLFKGPDFVSKHIRKKHPEKIVTLVCISFFRVLIVRLINWRCLMLSWSIRIAPTSGHPKVLRGMCDQVAVITSVLPEGPLAEDITRTTAIGATDLDIQAGGTTTITAVNEAAGAEKATLDR